MILLEFRLFIPTTWLAGNNFIGLRNKLLSENLIDKIVQLPYDIFEEAYIDSLILGLSAKSSNIVKTFKFDIREDVKEKHDYTKFDPDTT